MKRGESGKEGGEANTEKGSALPLLPIRRALDGHFFENALETKKLSPLHRKQAPSLLLLGRGLGHLAGAVLLLHGLDDANGDRLAHVAHGEAAERRVGRERLDAHRLGRDHLDVGGVAVLDELGRSLELLARAAVDLGLDLGELARDVGRVAVEHGGVAVGDLAGTSGREEFLRGREEK